MLKHHDCEMAKTFDTDAPFSNYTEAEKPINSAPNVQGSQIQVPQLLS